MVERMTGDAVRSVTAVSGQINVAILADLQRTTAVTRSNLDRMIAQSVDPERLMASANAVLASTLRASAERNRHIVESLLASSNAPAINAAVLAGVLRRKEAQFNLATPVPATIANPTDGQGKPTPLTQQEHFLTLLAVADLFSVLKDLREADLADFGVLLLVVAALLLVMAYNTPPEDSDQ
jgi:hypothetical protein